MTPPLSLRFHTIPVIHAASFRVPTYIRNVDPNAYEPQIISIGPSHRNKAALETMQEHKRQFQHELLQRNVTVNLEGVKCSVEDKAGQCYNGFEKYEHFWDNIVLDGCFIVELLLKLWEFRKKTPSPNVLPSTSPAETEMTMKPLSSVTETHRRHSSNLATGTARSPSSGSAGNKIHSKFVLLLPQITLDLLLLENQIPFRILEDLFDHIVPKRAEYPPSFKDLATGFFTSFINVSPKVTPSESVDHLLHLFHNCLVREQSRNRKAPQRLGRRGHEVSDKEFVNNAVSHILLLTACTPSVSELAEAGIEVMRDSRWWFKQKADNFMDVKFADGLLDIAPIAGSAYPILRNLVAFEHLNPNSGSNVTAYAYLLSALVKCPKDVTILRNKKVIPDWIGTEEDVTKRLNKLCEGVGIFEFEGYIWDVIARINGCYRTPYLWMKFVHNYFETSRESLIIDYLSNPWRILAVIGGIIILILTLLQAIFAILSYKHDLNQSPSGTTSSDYS